MFFFCWNYIYLALLILFKNAKLHCCAFYAWKSSCFIFLFVKLTKFQLAWFEPCIEGDYYIWQHLFVLFYMQTRANPCEINQMRCQPHVGKSNQKRLHERRWKLEWIHNRLWISTPNRFVRKLRYFVHKISVGWPT